LLFIRSPANIAASPKTTCPLSSKMFLPHLSTAIPKQPWMKPPCLIIFFLNVPKGLKISSSSKMKDGSFSFLRQRCLGFIQKKFPVWVFLGWIWVF
jgi:hypothetical protein